MATIFVRKYQQSQLLCNRERNSHCGQKETVKGQYVMVPYLKMLTGQQDEINSFLLPE